MEPNINIVPNILNIEKVAPLIKSSINPNITYVYPTIAISINLPFKYALFISNYEKYDVIPMKMISIIYLFDKNSIL